LRSLRSLWTVLLVASLSTGCATVRGPRAIQEVPPGGPPLSDWIRVRELEPSAEITVSTTRSRASTRLFVAADDTRLIALNLSSPALTPSSIRALRALAAQYPSALATLQATGALVQDGVRVGREGVFVADRRVAGLDEIVETIARDDVIEIDGPVVERGSIAGATLGGWLGFAVGVVPGLGGVGAAAWPILAGSVILGAYLGHRWSSHTADGIVYKAR
jgi:hypothetical protein